MPETPESPATAIEPAPSSGGVAAAPSTPTAQTAPAGDSGASQRQFTQEQLDRILSRERARFQREIAALRAQIESAAPPTVEAEQAAQQRPQSQHPAHEARRLQRELETRTREIEALRQRLQAQAVSAAVSSALAGLDWVGPDALELAEARLRALAVVEELEGREVVSLRDRDTDLDLADRAAVHAWLRRRFPSLLRAPSGSGAAHGRGNGAPVIDWRNLSPAERIALGISRR